MAFNWLKNMITGIPRGLGQLVQGKPRGAIGAFSDTVKPLAIAASAVPGPWQAVGIPLAAAAGAGQKFDDEGHRGITDILGGAAEGASLATGARMGGNLARSGISAVSGGGAIASKPGSMANILESSMPSVPSAAKPGFEVGSTVARSGTRLLPSVAESVAPKAGKGMLKGVMSYLGKNPELPLGIASTAADVYGAQQEGAAMDDWRKIREEEMRRRAELEQMQTLFNLVVGMSGRR